MSQRKPPSPKDYAVGYGKPPQASRFQKGRSGNPRGRPPGKTKPGRDASLSDIIKAEAQRRVKVADGGREITLTVAQAVVRSIGDAAAQGDRRAQQMFTRMVDGVERDDRRRAEELVEEAIKYKYSWEEEIERCRLQGRAAPKPVPHPDDVHIDMATGAVHITGPMTPEEKVVWDEMRARRPEIEASIAQHKELLPRARGRLRRLLEDEIALEQAILDRLDAGRRG